MKKAPRFGKGGGARLVGTKEMKETLVRLSRRFPQKAGAALRAEAEIEMKEAKRRTPVDTGVLRNSGRVDVEKSGRVIRASLSFGGAASAYAVRVHEDTEVWHRVGQAKYLESVLNESAPFLMDRVARRLLADQERGRGW